MRDGAKLLVANRGEVAVRVIRAARALGLTTAAVFSEDDACALHTRWADAAHPLRGIGPAAYLDAAEIVDVARRAGCTAVHPGYGFLSESADLAARCADAGLAFVGPTADTLELLADKTRARALAERCRVPVLPGTPGPATLEDVDAFFAGLAAGEALLIKAVAGGGGRGMRLVRSPHELAEAYRRCRSEAGAAFGDDRVYAERWVPRARHIEVQILGDGAAVSHLWERECSLQRRHQKLVEAAPAPGISEALRGDLLAAAVRLAHAVHYRGLGTFEFLVDEGGAFVFIEANPRLQVEHTVTEEVTGIDLVAAQLRVAAGRSLEDLELQQAAVPRPRGFAVQARVNVETIDGDGRARASGGTLTEFAVPTGPGVRVDTFAYRGYTVSPRFDSLLAKVIAHTPSGSFADAVQRAYQALCEFEIDGVGTNVAFLRNLLRHPDVRAHRIHTRFVEEHAAELTAAAATAHPGYASGAPAPDRGSLAGALVDPDDPLAVLAHGKDAAARPVIPAAPHDGTVVVPAPMQGVVVSVDVAEGEEVAAGGILLVMSAMKMEHEVEAPLDGIVRRLGVHAGDVVYEGHPLVVLEPRDPVGRGERDDGEIDLERVRPDLAEVRARHAAGLDGNRPEAVARRRATGHRTARENVEDLVDPGSFVEYGPLVLAAQRRRRSIDDLIARTPADGLVAGIGRINGELFGDARTRCVVMSYDYTVLAGTQGFLNHRKKDRMFELAEQSRLPVVFFTEGGGGRPGDTDAPGVAGLDCLAFAYFGGLSGLVPLVGITTGRCFAGNAALLGCCDVVIATAGSNIGMGGPAMVEGGGLGVFRAEEIGPMDVHVPNGVVDLPVADEAEAVAVARRYLGYFQGSLAEGPHADQRLLRHLVPENRLRTYDVRRVIDTLADTASVLELRRHFGPGMVTALARVEGRSVGVIANNPVHLAGAIDSNGADKAARFMQLCDAFDLPVLFLCDTPGIMVGPEAEKTALVRHACRMFVTGASLTVPFFTIVLRKGYGLGAQAMAGGSFKAPRFTVGWPSAEFGGMGLEGAVKLGFRKELAAIADAGERMAAFRKMVEAAYEHGKGVNVASHFELDDIIDPADSRRWIVTALRSTPPPAPRTGKKRPCIDTW
jgi:acetyl/propionyl-CoA carboxylase alpha subunit/acetyl-CoA carboxylase carboxyltransferase component